MFEKVKGESLSVGIQIKKLTLKKIKNKLIFNINIIHKFSYKYNYSV